MVFLGILGWVVVGLLVGFIVSKVVRLHGDDPRFGIAAAVVGAVAVAVVYVVASGAGLAVWSGRALVWSAVGAAAGAVLWHLVRSRYISHDSYTERRSY
jgi:uncharacterized membrane protein YeaQ/YmgE (transglycosylase-associated protein family)